MAKKAPLLKPAQHARELCLHKLELSGLDEADAKALGMEFLTANQMVALGHEAVPGLKINYFDTQAKPMVSWPKHPPFYRVRYLGKLPGAFGEVEDKEKRYAQPAGGAPCAYFPRSIDWVPYFNDLEPVIITEGELKAACACKFGLATIGLGGVQNWRARAFKGIDLLPELRAIPWVGRYLYICFDSDYLVKPDVCAALKNFAEAMLREGAIPMLVTLPELPGVAKTGLDDYLVAEGADNLRALLHVATPLGLARVLFDLNEKYTFVRDPGLIVAHDGLTKINLGLFKDGLESTKTYQEGVLKPDGSVSYAPVSAGKAWLSWPLRKEAKRICYAPGLARETPDHELNVWPGWGVEPVKGNVAPFMDLLKHLFTETEPEAMEWFLKWCAYPLQHPGTKLYSSAVFHGTHHGTGKTLVGETLGVIYGKNYTSIGQDDLHTSFNQWAEGRQFVMGDDVTGSSKREDNDRLKKLITQTELWVNTKYIPSYQIQDCVNYFLSSNHPDAFFMDDTDRRMFIHEVLVAPLAGDFYARYVKWLDRKGSKAGAAALFDYLLKLDLKGFDPAAAAFKTAARARMIDLGQSDLGGWVRRLKENADHMLKSGEVAITKDLFTSRELLRLYDPADKMRTTANGVARALKEAGFRQVCGGTPVRAADGSQDRFFAVRNFHIWSTANADKVREHLTRWAASLSMDGVKKKKF